MATKLERDYQSQLIKKIYERLPNAVVIKNDPDYIQGIPDLLIVNGRYWAALEVKRSAGAVHQPNQDYYIDLMNSMSYAAFIFPENEEEILDEVQRSLAPRRRTRIS